MQIILNFLKTSRRLFVKRKFFLFIVLACLVVGFSAFLSLYCYISFEYGYDRFNKNLDRIYRVQLQRTYPDRTDLSAGVSAGVGPVMKESFPEVERFVKLWGTPHLTNIIHYNDQYLEEEKLYFASEDLFNVFSFHFISGDPESSLREPNSAVITESFANKLFGDSDPLGKNITYYNPWGPTTIMITGVTKDTPPNSHLKYNVLVSFSTLENFISQARDSFGWSAFNTYLLLAEGANKAQLDQKMDEFIEKNYASLIERGIKVNLIFQPLSDVHLGPAMRFQTEAGGDLQILKTLSLAAIFILILAWLNYINLATSNAADRAKEVGIRKVTGATKKDLITQFLLEAFILNLAAVILSLMVVEMGQSSISSFIGTELPGSIYLRTDIWVVSFLLLLIGTLLSGLYPALSLASFKPAEVLKGQLAGSGFLNLRKGLVIFQLLISFILISSTLVIYKQIKFMQQENLGINLSQVLVAKGPGISDSTQQTKIDFLKQELKKNDKILEVANTTTIPGREITWVNNDVRWLGNPVENRYSMPFIGISSEYPSLMDLQLLEGRFFIHGKPNEEQKIILTKSAAKILGFADSKMALGEKVADSGSEYEVIGVAEDFHHQSLNKKIDPVIFRYVPQANTYLVFKLRTSSLPETLALIEQHWKKTLQGNPFDYFFLDDFFDTQYKRDVQFAGIFGIFSTIGIFIGALGLFALSLFMVRRRLSEISIRKVMGASETQIIKLFSREFLGIISIAVLIGVPVSWYLSGLLLKDYPYRIQYQSSLITIPLMILFGVCMITTGWQILKISRNNPVQTIREL